MIRFYTKQQMQQMERAAVGRGTTMQQLMEEAGFPYGIAERQDGQWHILRPCCLTPQTEAPSGRPA